MPQEKSAAALLQQGLAALQLPGQGEQAIKLLAYLSELERWNRRYSLTTASGNDLIIKHVLDSLAGLALIRQLAAGGQLLDIGSGAGFPAIPLALFLPDSQVTLCEKVGKKAVFLNNCLILLKIQNATVLQQDYRQLKQTWDLITFRAFTPLGPDMLPIFASLKPHGVIVAYKGRLAKIKEELTNLRVAEPTIHSEVIPVTVPFLDEARHLVVLSRQAIN